MLVALLFACSNPSPVAAPAPVPEAAPAPAAETTKVNLGKAPDETLALSIDDVIAKPGDYEGKAVVVKGAVATVCQKKGCWHKLGTGNPDVTVMVKDKEYEVFLPLDAQGKTAIVSGIFHTETLSIDDAKHFASDEGKDPSTITAPVTQFSIDVDGVKLI